VEDTIVLLDIVDQISEWSIIQFNVIKCNITAFIHDLQAIPRKRDGDDALRVRLAHVNLAGRPIGSLTPNEPLLGDYLCKALTASLFSDAHLRCTKEQSIRIGKALARAPLPPHIKQCLLLYGAHSKIAHTHCFMAIFSQSMKAVNSLLEKLSRKI
jgi:hypothetical protein